MIFHLGDILSVTTGVLVAPDHMTAVYRILDFLVGEKLWTHQLGRAADAAKPWMLEQLPWLAAIDASSVTADNWMSWLKAQAERYGAWHELEQLPPGRYAPRDPIDEAVDRFGSENVVVIAKGGQS